ncbi:hypothetical protein EGO58_07395 [Limosilactobacillus reuteri]|uniref:hypothetical protein n=1 Tax=Limosilactobacillus reuteri TaxID=1598 RepID=UPI000F4D4946|nr:hypothetical protein [Limosilactobacillus reuteri]MDZ5438668.1 hypothetical protein [Limosilactobacillus reuteri]ROV62803.1 hypothetical protein EGO58_07395 [Limosilactobacillus reuteri]
MTEIKQMATAPREERETIISYECLTGTWHIYTDEPKHARKYEKYVAHPQRKGYNSAGQLIMLEGDIDNGVVSIRKNISEQQRKKLSEFQKERHHNVNKPPIFPSRASQDLTEITQPS